MVGIKIIRQLTKRGVSAPSLVGGERHVRHPHHQHHRHRGRDQARRQGSQRVQARPEQDQDPDRRSDRRRRHRCAHQRQEDLAQPQGVPARQGDPQGPDDRGGSAAAQGAGGA